MLHTEIFIVFLLHGLFLSRGPFKSISCFPKFDDGIPLLKLFIPFRLIGDVDVHRTLERSKAELGPPMQCLISL